jgi:predicted amidophosphoribosyltransferase
MTKRTLRNSIFSAYQKIPRACVLCSAFSGHFNLCGHCAAELYARQEPVVRKDRELVVKSLFAWRKDGLPALRRVVHTMKGHEDPLDWREFALWMTEQFKTRRQRVLVPVPSRHANHSLGLARSLSKWTGWPLVDALEVVGKREQKSLTREGRQSVRFHMKPQFQCKEFTGVVIVDDVVTTGATAHSCFHALGSPKGVEVWCLMDRRPCGLDGALL